MDRKDFQKTQINHFHPFLFVSPRATHDDGLNRGARPTNLAPMTKSVPIHGTVRQRAEKSQAERA